MVQNDSSNSGDEGSPPVAAPNPAKGIPLGKYRLVGWGVDTTGRRLIDEICQIAAYSPSSQFSQYIMPFSDLNPSYRRKHSIRVVNTGRYRMLKDMRSNKFVKTKSDVAALTDFLEWLEKVQGDDAHDGIILIYHEIRKASPGMLLEVLRRYNLLERFAKIVKGFANGFNIAQAKCAKTTKSFSLRVMAKVLLNREDEDFSSAVDRARVSYEIAAHLAQGERQDLDEKKPTGTEPEIINFVCPFVNPISAEEDEIAQFKVLLERQNTFRPVFGALLRASRPERQHATHLRRLLAENNINYDKLKQAYEDGAKDGLDKVLKSEVANAKETELSELLDILDCFFDPEKKAVQPKPRYYQNNNNRKPRGTRKSFNKDRNSESTSSPNASSDNATEKTGTESEKEKTVEVQ
ncbi:maternal protein exuperantia-1 [Tribolium castaneum]|uniref:Exuperantia n=1 Tax=Tribolium castaneum TaxID=7070 RepID=D6WRU5_TRICA|nr:PREDICTED: maternal protein exuperantia-1 [Tribolium castaneum]XP_974770.1 PREDICTED: maternal protein exuperantia-1 [Tribolium castaneum]EFA07494.1 exuperantia [Tribolium castaneum]|eukprot:XP_015836695.1 PREDICTED: maternal protein exuperantia-1 [Tribolium castaneum]